MSVIIPSGYAQIVLNYTGSYFASGRGATVLGFGGSGPIEGDADDFASEVVGAWDNNMAPETYNGITLESVYWATTNQSGVVNANITGGNNFDTVPPNSAVLMSYSTGFKGPRARGRSYWPGLASDTTTSDTGIISAGRLAEIQAALGGFFVACESFPTQHVILQREEPGQVTPPLSPPPPVVSRVLSNRLATQRRRLRP